MIHGDLKGVRNRSGTRPTIVLTSNQPSILVDGSGRARITDFGLATMTQDQGSLVSVPDDHGHTARWIAPEVLDGHGTHSKEADVFSFAMVMIEVRYGLPPVYRVLTCASK